MFPSRTSIVSQKVVSPSTYSVLFDGTNDHADTGATFESIWSASFSISLWYRTPSSFAAGVDNFLGIDTRTDKGSIEFRTRQVSSSTQDIELYFATTVTGSAPYGLSGAHVGSGDYLAVDTWYHLVWTADRPGTGTTASKLYINGSEVTLLDISGFSKVISDAGGTFDANTLIAARNNAASGSGSGELFLNGYLDEIAFFNSAISSGDVTTIYNSGVPADITSLSPSHWWRMGDGDNSAGTTITDQTGSTDLTLVNGSAFSTEVPA